MKTTEEIDQILKGCKLTIVDKNNNQVDWKKSKSVFIGVKLSHPDYEITIIVRQFDTIEANQEAALLLFEVFLKHKDL